MTGDTWHRLCRHSKSGAFGLLSVAAAMFAIPGFSMAQELRGVASPQVAAITVPHAPDLATRRWKYFYGPRAYPFAKIPPGAQEAARQDYARKWGATFRAAAAPFISATAWKPIGPAPIAGFSSNSGRTNSIAVHPTDPNIIYVGAADGGVWKTVDGGASWAPLTDRQCSLAMGAIAIDPVNPSIVYAATGEENFSGDSQYGCGVLRSTDAGATWTQLGASVFSPTTGGAAISRVVVDPTTAGSTTATKVYVASSVGVYRSTDSGATWSPVLPAAPATDLIVDPITPTTLYAAIGNIFGGSSNGVYRSTDGGASWSRLGGGLPTLNIGRINLAIAQSAPATVYASIQDASTFGLLGVWKTVNAGTTWATVAATGASCNSQCWYDMYFAVDPTNANVVYFGGFSVYKSSNGGASFVDIGAAIHVDHHGFAFDPTNHNVILDANDGGIFRSADAGATWKSLNSNLSLTQFYPGVSLHPTNVSIAMGGTQDNGTNLFTGTLSWSPILGGDGGFTAIDYVTPTTAFGEFEWIVPGDGPFRTDNLGVAPNWLQKATGINPNDPALFIPPLVMSQSYPSILYFGTTRLYKTSNRGDAWNAISPDLSKGGGSIAAIAQANRSLSLIYVGTSDGNVQVTKDGGVSWTAIVNGLPNRSITDLAISPVDGRTVFATVSGFGSGHVFKTVNAGLTWLNISSALPDIPVNTILLDPAAPLSNIYVGTDLGVFRTTDGGVTWTPFNNMLPNVVVIDLVLNTTTGTLLAATHGRGAWELAMPSAPVISLAPATRDYGAVLHGTSADRFFTVTNIGQGTLTGNATLGGSAAFSVVSGGAINLGASASQTVTIRFAPAAAGRFDADLNFSSNGGVAEAVLSGAGR